MAILLIVSFALSPLTTFALTQDIPVSVKESSTEGSVVDPNSGSEPGAFQYKYAFQVPPGRNGMTPDLNLSYSSGNRDDQGFGYGWMLSIPYIQRYNKTGIENTYSTTSPFFFSSLSGELVYVSTSTQGGVLGSSASIMNGAAATPSAMISSSLIQPSATTNTGTLNSQNISTSSSDIATTTHNQRVVPSNSPQLKLKAPVNQILGAKELKNSVVKYAYRTNITVDSVPAKEETAAQARKAGRMLGKEVLGWRTSQSRTFETDKKDVFVKEVMSGDPHYYFDSTGTWWVVDYGTTTKDAFVNQIAQKPSLLGRLASLFLPEQLFAQTATFYPDPNPETASVDGWTYFDLSTDWATARSHSSSNFYDDSGDGNNILDQFGNGNGPNYYGIRRAFLLFDTSSLTHAGTIISASLNIYVTGVTAGGSEKRFYVVGSTPGSNTSIGSNDYSQVGGTSYGVSTSTYSTNAYTSIPLNATGIGSIALTGVTKLALRTYNDFNNVTPTAGNQLSVDFGSAEHAGTSQDPNLVVVYAYAGDVSGTYQTRNDDGSFLKYVLNGDAWTVTDKSGNTYLFGTSTIGRQNSSSFASTTWKWMLQQATDPNGNSITYSYTKDSGQIYPSAITYTNNGTTTGIFSVNFALSPRATSTATSSATGFPVQTKYQISGVTVSTNGTTTRSYSLAYKAGDNGSRTQLATITETGQNASSTVTLPATTFNYSTSTAAMATSTWTNPTGTSFVGSGVDQGVVVADVNGDGLADIVKSHQVINSGTVVSSTQSVYLNSTTGWILSSTTPPCNFTWSPQFSSQGAANQDGGGRLVDINGDGLPDFVCTQSVYLNTGSAWVASSTWSLPVSTNRLDSFNNYDDNGVRFSDINGDGLPDILNAGPQSRQVYINNGHGWTRDLSWQFPTAYFNFTADFGRDGGGRTLDVNGDGLADLLPGVDNGGTSTSTVYINTGNGWSYDPAWTLPSDAQPAGYNFRAFDINNDGLPDLEVADATIDPFNNYSYSGGTVYLNTGAGWKRDYSRALPFPYYVAASSGSGETGTQSGNVNGNGLADSITSGVAGSMSFEGIMFAQGDHPDLLKSVAESGGKTIAVTYQETSKFKDGSGNILNPLLAFDFPAVQSISYSDGVSSTTIDNYQYKDGLLYFGSPTDRRPAGFGTVTKTDAVGNVSKTYYHQGSTTQSSLGEYNDDQSKIGRAYRIENYNGLNTLYSLLINKWDKYDRGNSSNFLKLVRSTSLSYDGDSAHRDTSETSTYDNPTGNLIEKIQWGEVSASSTDGSFTDTGSDKRTTDIMYAASSTGLISLPSDSTTTDQGGTRIRETRNYYDGLTLGSITAGNLTKQESWKSGSTYINTQTAYTSFGLVASTTDPRGKSTTYTYDAYNMYPATITDPLSHSTAKWYDYASGKATQTKDPNGLVFQSLLDPLGRISVEKQPDLVTPSTLVTKAAYTYTDTGMPKLVRKTSYLDASTSIDLYAFLDGFGRTIETRSTAEGTNTYTAKDSQYDGRGLLISESLPFFASSTGYTGTSSPATTTLVVKYAYDPLQRLLTTVNAVGTTSNAYHQWKVTTTDANGHSKDFIKDAYGNLATVVEYNSTTTTGTTTYAYNGNNNLTQITDAAGNIRNFTYDGLGRRLTAQDLHTSTSTSFGSTTYAYDDAGNLTQQIDAKNQTVNRTYDDVNRLLTEDYTAQAGTEATYRYDWCAYGIGHLCSVVSAAASTTNQYNALGLLASETKTISSTTFATTYAYDRLGDQTLITLPDNSQVKYDYNNAGRLAKVSRKDSSIAGFVPVVSAYSYAPTGKVSYKLYGNCVASTYTYDASHLYRLTNILTVTNGCAGGSLQGFAQTGGALGGVSLANTRTLALAPMSAFALDVILSTSSLSDVGTTTVMESTTPSSLLISPDVAIATDATTTPDNSATSTPTNTASSTPADISTTTSSQDASSSTPLDTGSLAATTTLATGTTTPELASTTADISTTTPAADIADEYQGNSFIKAEYALSGESLKKTDGDTDVVIGDKRSKKFTPKATFEKFGGSASLEIAPRETSPSDNVSLVGNMITWGRKGKHTRFYSLPHSNDLPQGGYEIDLVLDKKPATNTVSFDVNSRNLDFFYQGPLDQAGITEADHCTATECFDKDGNVIAERPENVVGSYAVYYKDGVSGDYSDIGGRNYGTGKAFHIFRPKITDVVGVSTWADLDINQAAGKMTITIPQAFLDTATYPITVDPTFGYGTVGATSANTTNAVGSQFTMPENGTVTKITQYTKAASGTTTVGAAMYSDNAGAPNGLLTFQISAPVQGTTATWVDVPVKSFNATSSVKYWLWGASTASRTLYWDTGAINQYNVQGISGLSWPNPITPGTYFARKISIYATYTAASTTPQTVSAIQNISFAYDAVGNITQITDYSNTGAGKTVVYGYDGLNRLMSASTTAASSTPFRETYTYDLLGNITNKSDRGPYIYGGTGFPNPDAPTSIGGVPMTYDNDGNLTSDGAWNHSWDYLNRLTQSGNGGATTTYAYDVTGDRVKMIAGGITTLYPNMYFNAALGSASTTQIFANGELVATAQTNTGGSLSTSTPAYVQGNYDSSTGNPVTLPNAVTNGDLVIVGVTVYNQTIPSNAVTDNKGNTYTKIGEAVNGTDHAALFYASNVTGGSSFTVSKSVSGSIAVQEYSGIATSSPLDKSNTASSTSAVPTSGAVTTSTGNELYVGLAWSNGNGDSWTAGSGYTLRQQETNNNTRERFATEDMVNVSGTTTQAYFTTSSSNRWAGVIGTFKPGTSSGAGVHYVHNDQLSGSNVVTDQNGNTEEVSDYYPFGGARIDQRNSSFNEQRKYAGTIRDDSTNLDYMQARYYNSTRGQFLSEDPVAAALGDQGQVKALTGASQQAFLTDPQQFNSYSYAGNNPISKSDPTGKCPWCVLPLLGAGGGILGQYAVDVSTNIQNNGLHLGDFTQNLSSPQTYLTRAAEGAAIALTGGAAAATGLGLVGQATVVGVSSGAIGAAGNAYLGQKNTAQSVTVNTILSALTFGASEYTPGIPGRLPNFGTQAFFTGAHTQESALKVGVDASSYYLSSALTSLSVTLTQLNNTLKNADQQNSKKPN